VANIEGVRNVIFEGNTITGIDSSIVGQFSLFETEWAGKAWVPSNWKSIEQDEWGSTIDFFNKIGNKLDILSIFS
jgi:hypothetical protein